MNGWQMLLEFGGGGSNWSESPVPSRVLVRSPIGVAIHAHVHVTCTLEFPSNRKTSTSIPATELLGGVVRPFTLRIHSNSRIHTFTPRHRVTFILPSVPAGP